MAYYKKKQKKGAKMSVFDQIQKESAVVDSWKKWQEYRLSLTAFLCEQLADDKEIVIVGAGRCDDMDLAMLSAQKSKIYLADIDEKAMEEAVTRLQAAKETSHTILEKVPNVEQIVCGVDGTDASMYRDFCEKLVLFLREYNDGGLRDQTKAVLEAFDAYALALVQEYDSLASRQEMEHLSRLPKADAYICIGVCSQLQTTFAYTYHVLRRQLLQLLGEEAVACEGIKRFEAYLKQRNEKGVALLLKTILKKANHTVVFGNEYARVYPDGTLAEHTPIEGAYQAILAMRELFTKIPIECQEYALFWPFDLEHEIGYEMILQVVNKK